MTAPAPPTPAPPAAAGKAPSSCLGCGVGSVVAAFLAVAVGFTWVNYRAAQGFREHAGDPAARRADFVRVLPADELPPGYHPVGGLKVPALLAMAAAADREPGPLAAGEPGVRSAFLFVRTRDLFDRKAGLATLFTGEAADPGAFEQNEVRFTSREVLGRGELEAGGARVLYLARRGELAVDPRRFGAIPEDVAAQKAREGTDEARSERFTGLATMMLLDCGHDGWLRVALWFAPDPSPETPAADRDGTGTPADPEAIRAFLGHFRVCG